MSHPAESPSQLALSRGPTDPNQYSSTAAKARFAVSKFYGMGSDGQWAIEDIADALDVSTRQVYNYLNESEIGREVEKTLAVTEAEWRLDAALRLRREVDRLEEIEKELLQRTTAVPTEFDEETIEGLPTGDGEVVIADAHGDEVKLAIPTGHEEVIDYGPDLERVQKEKRKHIQQIVKLLGLEVHERVPDERGPSGGSDERAVVEYRDVGDDGCDDDAR